MFAVAIKQAIASSSQVAFRRRDRFVRRPWQQMPLAPRGFSAQETLQGISTDGKSVGRVANGDSRAICRCQVDDSTVAHVDAMVLIRNAVHDTFDVDMFASCHGFTPITIRKCHATGRNMLNLKGSVWAQSGRAT
jgi:hypothetical protein